MRKSLGFSTPPPVSASTVGPCEVCVLQWDVVKPKIYANFNGDGYRELLQP